MDGRHGIPTVFDGVGLATGRAFPLRLKSVERREGDMIWVRYEKG
ncbi:MAG TPA: hypothetical protein VMS37_24690 [Verrucomicrobiae bacterium]|nr:hypothetical protein [Verrucomicrobiae bacterium]